MRKRGTNKYQSKYHNWLGVNKKTYNSILWLILIVLALFWFFWYFVPKRELINPVVGDSGICGTDRCRIVSKEELTIENMIKDTFKEHSARAFQLLKCENGRLNPLAVNVNRDGSRDLGIFQINEFWQKTQAKFLLNPKINIAIAYQLFMENGKRFSLWTCGKKLAI